MNIYVRRGKGNESEWWNWRARLDGLSKYTTDMAGGATWVEDVLDVAPSEVIFGSCAEPRQVLSETARRKKATASGL